MNKRCQLLKLVEEIEAGKCRELFEVAETDEPYDRFAQRVYQAKSDGYLEIDKDACYTLSAKGVVYLQANSGNKKVTNPKSPWRDKPATKKTAAKKDKPQPPADEPAETEEPAPQPSPAAEQASDSTDLISTFPFPIDGQPEPSGINPIQIAEHENYCIGGAIEQLMQAKHSMEPVRNLRTAMYLIYREIKRLEGGAA